MDNKFDNLIYTVTCNIKEELELYNVKIWIIY